MMYLDAVLIPMMVGLSVLIGAVLLIFCVDYVAELRLRREVRREKKRQEVRERDLKYIRETQEQLRLFLENRPSPSSFGR